MPSAPRRSALILASVTALPAALIAGLVVFWLLGGFTAAPKKPATGPVAVSAPPSADGRCAALIAGVPSELAGARARPVSAAAEQAAAWGDPPIVLRCGVAKPTVPATAQLLAIEGIEWTTAETRGAVVWTSTSTPVPVEVVVPDAYRDRAATDILNPLAAALKSAF